MKEIAIGNVIVMKRKEKGLTQEELAKYLGVSKPAVSKWESGQCYPDITLLPVIAAYFNITVDELIGYQSTLTKEEIRVLYRKLSAEFYQTGFDETYKQCTEYIRKYHSCWSVVFHMGLLIINNLGLVTDADKKQSLYEELITIFAEVKECSEDIALKNQARQLEALCYLQLNECDKVIELLGDKPEIPVHKEPIVAKAFLMKGEEERAIQMMQGHYYHLILDLVGSYPSMLELYLKNPKKMIQWVQTLEPVIKGFELSLLHPSICLNTYINIAILFMMAGETEKALYYLHEYVEILNQPNLFPIALHGSDLFDSVDYLIREMDLGKEPVRNEELIKKDLVSVVVSHPVWEPVREQAEYKKLVKKVQTLL